MADLQEAIHKRSKLFLVSVLLLFGLVLSVESCILRVLASHLRGYNLSGWNWGLCGLFVAVIYSLWRCVRSRILKFTNKAFPLII